MSRLILMTKLIRHKKRSNYSKITSNQQLNKYRKRSHYRFIMQQLDSKHPILMKSRILADPRMW